MERTVLVGLVCACIFGAIDAGASGIDIPDNSSLEYDIALVDANPNQGYVLLGGPGDTLVLGVGLIVNGTFNEISRTDVYDSDGEYDAAFPGTADRYDWAHWYSSMSSFASGYCNTLIICLADNNQLPP
mgnify:CR=1 FL=1